MMMPSPGEDAFAAMARVAADPEAFAKRISELKEATEASEAKLAEAARATERLQAAEAAFAKSQSGISQNAADLAAREKAVFDLSATNTAALISIHAATDEIEKKRAALGFLMGQLETREAAVAGREAALDLATAEAKAEKLRLRRIAEAMRAACAGLEG